MILFRKLKNKMYILSDFVKDSYGEPWSSSCEKIMSPSSEQMSLSYYAFM